MIATLTPDASSQAPPADGATDVLVRSTRGGVIDPVFGPALGYGAALYTHLVRARTVSARMIGLQRATRIGVHTSSIGEEAAIVGAALAARATDWLFPGAREWYTALARGMPLATYVHHAFGSAEGPTRGHAAPDHVPARRFLVASPSGVASAHLPQAVGAAWAARASEDDVVAVAVFGAEIAASGDFHNALNFAGVFKAPVVFVCRSRAASPVASRAVAYGVAHARVDGSDALAVFEVVRAAITRAREARGATLVDVSSPVLPRIAELDDAALASGDVLDLGDGDPIGTLARLLTRERRLDPSAREAIAREVRAELDEAIAAAERAGVPAPRTIFEHVYAGMPIHLAAQAKLAERASITGRAATEEG